MVNHDAVAGTDAMSFLVVDRNPILVDIGRRMGALVVGGSGFFVSDFLHQAADLAD